MRMSLGHPSPRRLGRSGPARESPCTLTIEPSSKLPRSAFSGWNGTVDPARRRREVHYLTPALRNSDSRGMTARTPHPAEHLKWLFGEIARYGQPLIVWTNSSPRHLEFLKTIKPSARLTFLLLYEAKREPSVPELVDEDQIDEALERSEMRLPPIGEAGDEYLERCLLCLCSQ